jgi:hypothetical protein
VDQRRCGGGSLTPRRTSACRPRRPPWITTSSRQVSAGGRTLRFLILPPPPPTHPSNFLSLRLFRCGIPLRFDAFLSHLVSRSQAERRRLRTVVAQVVAARVRRHAHLIPLRIPHRVRAPSLPRPLMFCQLCLFQLLYSCPVVRRVFMSISCFRVVNEPLESISTDLGFAGNTLVEGTTAPFQLQISGCFL